MAWLGFAEVWRSLDLPYLPLLESCLTASLCSLGSLSLVMLSSPVSLEMLGSFWWKEYDGRRRVSVGGSDVWWWHRLRQREVCLGSYTVYSIFITQTNKKRKEKARLNTHKCHPGGNKQREYVGFFLGVWMRKKARKKRKTGFFLHGLAGFLEEERSTRLGRVTRLTRYVLRMMKWIKCYYYWVHWGGKGVLLDYIPWWASSLARYLMVSDRTELRLGAKSSVGHFLSGLSLSYFLS